MLPHPPALAILQRLLPLFRSYPGPVQPSRCVPSGPGTRPVLWDLVVVVVPAGVPSSREVPCTPWPSPARHGRGVFSTLRPVAFRVSAHPWSCRGRLGLVHFFGVRCTQALQGFRRNYVPGYVSSSTFGSRCKPFLSSPSPPTTSLGVHSAPPNPVCPGCVPELPGPKEDPRLPRGSTRSWGPTGTRSLPQSLAPAPSYTSHLRPGSTSWTQTRQRTSSPFRSLPSPVGRPSPSARPTTRPGAGSEEERSLCV